MWLLDKEQNFSRNLLEEEVSDIREYELLRFARHQVRNTSASEWKLAQHIEDKKWSIVEQTSLTLLGNLCCLSLEREYVSYPGADTSYEKRIACLIDLPAPYFGSSSDSLREFSSPVFLETFSVKLFLRDSYEGATRRTVISTRKKARKLYYQLLRNIRQVDVN